MRDNSCLRLYAITGSVKSGETLADAVEKAIMGGVTLIQLREKNVPYQQFLESAFAVKAVCRKYGVPLIINDSIYICAAVKADGVHLGQGDMPAAEARRLLGKDAIIGVTAKTPEQALAAFESGADYIGSGAVFGTKTKSDAKKITVEELKTIALASPIPTVAIGGITAENLPLLKDTGISGVAVVSAIFAADDIKAAAATLLDAVNRTVV